MAAEYRGQREPPGGAALRGFQLLRLRRHERRHRPGARGHGRADPRHGLGHAARRGSRRSLGAADGRRQGGGEAAGQSGDAAACTATCRCRRSSWRRSGASRGCAAPARFRTSPRPPGWRRWPRRGCTVEAARAARLAVIFAVASGSVVYTRRFYEQVTKQGAKAASPMLFPETVYNAPASHLAALLGIDGATYTLVGDNSVGPRRAQNGGATAGAGRGGSTASWPAPRRWIGCCAKGTATGVSPARTGRRGSSARRRAARCWRKVRRRCCSRARAMAWRCAGCTRAWPFARVAKAGPRWRACARSSRRTAGGRHRLREREFRRSRRGGGAGALAAGGAPLLPEGGVGRKPRRRGSPAGGGGRASAAARRAAPVRQAGRGAPAGLVTEAQRGLTLRRSLVVATGLNQQASGAVLAARRSAPSSRGRGPYCGVWLRAGNPKWRLRRDSLIVSGTSRSTSEHAFGSGAGLFHRTRRSLPRLERRLSTLAPASAEPLSHHGASRRRSGVPRWIGSSRRR